MKKVGRQRGRLGREKGERLRQVYGEGTQMFELV